MASLKHRLACFQDNAERDVNHEKQLTDPCWLKGSRNLVVSKDGGQRPGNQQISKDVNPIVTQNKLLPTNLRTDFSPKASDEKASQVTPQFNLVIEQKNATILYSSVTNRAAS